MLRPPVTAACVLLLSGASALRNMDLITDAGEEVIKGGAPVANCHACLAVMEDLELAMQQPFEKVDIGKDSKAARERRHRLNRELYVQQVLDPKRCSKSMEEYDLSYLHGTNTFVRKASSKMLPVHMELNDWAKRELTQFCESFMEEYEEVRTLHRPHGGLWR